MKTVNGISASVIARLPRYYRFLGELLNTGVTRVSSQELSERMGLTASQIRHDFNCFGGFGQQGYGYNVEQLKNEMAAILDLNAPKEAILVGAGNMGRAVANQMNFEAMGFRLTAIYDSDPNLQRLKIKGIPILPAAEMLDRCAEKKPDMAILCLPQAAAPEVVDGLIMMGVDSFWNFSHYDIHAKYPAANVENVHLSDSLMTLSYKIKNSETGGFVC